VRAGVARQFFLLEGPSALGYLGVIRPASSGRSNDPFKGAMMANSVGYHESESKLKPQTLDSHRALTSMQEELEAADWYDQRVDAAADPELKEILAHNRDEEKEHFAMLLEWYRRRDPTMDTCLKEYLFTSGSLVAREQAGGGDASAGAPTTSAGSLGIGSLKGGPGL
jgi:ferritin-like protein